MHKNAGLVLAFAAPLVYSIMNVGTRLQLDSSLTVWGLLLMRGSVGLIFLGLAAKLLKKELFGKNRLRLALVGLTSFLSTVCLVLAIANIPLYQALVLLYLFPALTVPLDFFLNNARVSRRTLLWVLAAFAGCVILIWPDSAAGLHLSRYHLVGLASALIYGLALVLGAPLGEANSGLEPIFYYSLWAVFGTACVILLGGEPTGLSDGSTAAAAFGLGCLGCLALLLTYTALRWLPPFQVGVIGSLEAFGGALASWLIFDDPITARALVGGLIILIAAIKLKKS